MPEFPSVDWQNAATRLAALALCRPQFFNGGMEDTCDICQFTRAEHDERDVWRLKVFEHVPHQRLAGT